jgi:hypothetical protein
MSTHDDEPSRGMPDELRTEVTDEDHRKVAELLATSDITHCIRCMEPAPASGFMSQGGGVGGLRNKLTGDEFLYAFCSDCDEDVDNWLRGERDEVLGVIDENLE